MSKLWMGIFLVFFFQVQAGGIFAADAKTEAKPDAKPAEVKSEPKPEAKTEAKPEAKKEMKAAEPKVKTVYKAPPKKSQVVGFDANGNPVYFGENYPTKQASLDELQGSLSNTSMNVARAICDLSTRPQTVTVPAGAATLTWETEKLCKAVKSEKK